jgi:arylsulfatase A-like enzyme
MNPGSKQRVALMLLALLISAAHALLAQTTLARKQKPNVLFIAVDDLNDWISLLDKDAPIKTPNLERLARRGVTFTRAYAASPACNPSRTALLTGLRPSSTGVYGNTTDWRRALPDAVTLPQHFRAHGYRVAGAGRIFHHHYDGAFHDRASFDDFRMLAPEPYPPQRLTGLTALSLNFDYGPWPPNEADLPDSKTVNYATEFLRQPPAAPFFLAVGIFRPHMPHYVPAEYFARFPLDKLRMPEVRADDLEDLPAVARELIARDNWVKNFLPESSGKTGTLKGAVQAYQAAAEFADAQIGRVLDALDRSPAARNTIIVLWSDNGFQLGEKRKWEKFTLWEKATRVPFIVVAPGVTKPGGRCERPVSLLDVYPTLIALGGLTAKPELEGVSLLPLLRNPRARWERPAVMTWEQGNHAVRSQRWRYIRYRDGGKELYDHHNDPHEWRNLAGQARYQHIIAAHQKWLPAKNAAPAPNMTDPAKK